MEIYLTWDGKREITVGRFPFKNGRKTISEPVVKRTLENPSMELHKAIFDQDTGTFNDKTAPNMTTAERAGWLHLWDGVCCESISHAEAWDCVSLGYVMENLKVRASNYMHLV